MKYLSIIPVLAVLMAGTAQAQTNYAELRGGAMWLNDATPSDRADSGGQILGINTSFDTGWLAAVAVGRDFAGPLRAEIEYSHRQADIDSVTGSVVNAAPPPPFLPFTGNITGDVAIDALMINAYADTPLSAFVLYAGLGVGVAFSDTTFDGIGKTDTNFAFQLMAGAEYPVSPTVSLTAGYNLFVVEDIAFGNDNIDVTSQAAVAGVRFKF